MERKDFRTLREELHKSQDDVAALLDVSRITYIKWEQHPDMMPLGKYIKLINELERLKDIKEHGKLDRL